MFGPWKIKVTQLETQIANNRQEIAKAQAYAQALFKHGKEYAGKYNSFFQPALAETANNVQSFLSSQDLALVGSWEEAQWQNWLPQATIIEPIIRIGEQVEQRQRGGLNFSIPDFAPFIGSNQTIIIRSSNQTRDIGLALLQSLVIRTALMLPHQARYTLLDPAGNGAAFPMFRQLKEAQSVRELDSNDVSRDLEVVKKDIQRLNAYYLDAESESFEKLPEDLRINERFEFIFAADFPNKYDRRAIEALQNVCECVLRPAGYKIGFTRDRKNITHYLNYLLGELERRSQLDDDEHLSLPTIFAVMTELDQVDEMRRVDDGYGLTDSPCGQLLYRLYREGPSVGIHSILSFSGIRPFINVVDDRRGLVNFRHRVALQMSEDESFTFIRNRNASRLQIEGSIPISALYMDVENDKSVRFKPYSVESDIPLVEQLAQIGQTLKLRSQQV